MALDGIEPAQKTNQKSPASLQDSFIRSVGRTVRTNKLGDLLLNSSLITRDQLRAALKAQKETGERLGRVLLQQGSISATQLYRKLAEQWVLKVSTAGMALMMQILTPSAARADDGGAVRLAAAFTPGIAQSIKPAAYPQLFGASEVRSANISAFTKWTAVMSRFDQQMRNDTGSPVVSKWKTQLQDLKGKSVRQQIEGVNNYINSVGYIEDSANYRKSDYWATPIEFLSHGGDCEDFAIAKYASLRALGFSSDQMRIAIVQDKVKNIPHAILIIYADNQAFVLDNQDKRVENADNVNRYKPIFSINSNNWWLYKPTHVS
ncbi:MAG: transglutaminase-like cysteine peptidase [Alphaproteobacteria bacterium]